MKQKVIVKIKPELSIKRFPKMRIYDSFIPDENLQPISQYQGTTNRDRLIIKRFRNSILQYRGFKMLRLPWEDVDGERHTAEISFGDDLGPEDIEILDSLLYVARDKDMDFNMQVKTYLSIGGQPIMRFMSGYFEDQIWYPLSAAEDLEDSICLDDDGNEVAIPFTWHFEVFNLKPE